MKKKVIAYLHTHWDREWYREFEIFRLRLIRVFDNVLELLEQKKIPSFYFDGQTCALEDYLEIKPEKKKLVQKFIAEKKLFIGPCYTLVDEFLTDEKCFRKNLEIGLNYAKSMGCKDFIGYFADTFGHSKNIPLILKEFGIENAVVWRGCPETLPSEFMFNGIKTVNLVRGYFNDIFSAEISYEKKVDFLKTHLDKIAEKSSNVLLMPIGADHLGIEEDISQQIEEVNKLLKDYEIELSSPFKYFELVKNNFNYSHNEELLDNSKTFILQGCWSARTDIKQKSAECSYKLDLANKFQIFSQKKYKTKSYDSQIEYAYKLLLQNLAHDGICGCSTDEVHAENILRYKKILQIADSIIEEIKLDSGESSFIVNLSDHDFSGVIEFETDEIVPPSKAQLISTRQGFEDNLLYNTQRIPVTEDYKDIYTYLTEIECKSPSKVLSKPKKLYPEIFYEIDLKVSDTRLENSNIVLTFKNGKINLINKKSGEQFVDFIQFYDFKDKGDCYNFGPAASDKGLKSELISSKIKFEGKLLCSIEAKFKIDKTLLSTEFSLTKNSEILKIKTNWKNKTKNHLLQIGFYLKEPVDKTLSKDMGYFVERNFDPNYEIRKNLPKIKGIEAKTNTAPMQGYLQAQGVEFLTKGLFEYEVKKNQILITLLRSIGIISNPKNPARTTPAGPPIPVHEAFQLNQNSTELAIGFGNINDAQKRIEEMYPQIIVKYGNHKD